MDSSLAYCKTLSTELFLQTAPAYKDNLTLIRSAFRPLLVPKRIQRCLPLRDIRNIPIQVNGNTATLDSTYWYIPRFLVDTLCDMAVMHSSICGEHTVKGRIALIRGTPCPKWHVDKVKLRGICTLIGPGCVARQDDQVLELESGDALFMKGCGADEKWEEAVWHRSPLVSKTDLRLVVQTDC